MKITKLLASITLAAVCTFVFDTNSFSAPEAEQEDECFPLYQNAFEGDDTINDCIEIDAEYKAGIGYVFEDTDMPLTNSNGDPLTVPTRNGYVFAGYYDEPDGGTQYYYPDMTSAHAPDSNIMYQYYLYAHWIPITIASDESNPTCDNDTVGATSGDTALDAVWNANTLNLKFMANGQQFATNTCTYGQNITIPTGTPTRTGYNFTGWVVHSDE